MEEFSLSPAPPAAPTSIAFPWGQSLTQQCPGGGTSPRGDEVSRQPAANTSFCCNAGGSGANSSRLALAVISHEITGLGEGQGGDSEQGGSCGGAGCGHGAGDGAGRAQSPPALTTYCNSPVFNLVLIH